MGLTQLVRNVLRSRAAKNSRSDSNPAIWCSDVRAATERAMDASNERTSSPKASCRKSSRWMLHMYAQVNEWTPVLNGTGRRWGRCYSKASGIRHNHGRGWSGKSCSAPCYCSMIQHSMCVYCARGYRALARARRRVIMEGSLNAAAVRRGTRGRFGFREDGGLSRERLGRSRPRESTSRPKRKQALEERRRGGASG